MVLQGKDIYNFQHMLERKRLFVFADEVCSVIGMNNYFSGDMHVNNNIPAITCMYVDKHKIMRHWYSPETTRYFKRGMELKDNYIFMTHRDAPSGPRINIYHTTNQKEKAILKEDNIHVLTNFSSFEEFLESIKYTEQEVSKLYLGLQYKLKRGRK